MLYLTGQLLFFLLVTAFVGFIVGWLLRGAMLPVSMLEGNDYRLHGLESSVDNASYQSSNYQLANNSVTGAFKETFTEAETAET